MGSQSKYKEKELMFVNIKPETPADPQGGGGAPSFAYGFATNIKTGDRSELGQVKLELASPPQRLIIGTSFPKPMRASKRQGAGSGAYFVSSFADVSKKNDLKGKGWQVSRSKRLARIIDSDAALVKTVFVTVRGIKYAWQRNKVTVTNATEAKMASLGHKVPTQTDFDELCFGGSFPRPPRATLFISGSGSDGSKRISTYYDPSGTLGDGWQPSGSGRQNL